MEPLKVFYSYAHEDRELCEALKKHLRPLKRAKLISDWYDRDISAGEEWEKAINHHLGSADLIILLVSIDFIDSDYCWGKELKRAMERHENGEARVVPVILRHCDWTDAPFSKLQCLPFEAKPVTGWLPLDAALYDVAQGVRRAIEELRRLRTGQRSPEVKPEPRIPPVIPSELSTTGRAFPTVESVHCLPVEEVQGLQERMAQALGRSVEFSDRLRDGGQAPQMVVIPAGEFLMGSPETEEGRNDNERQHTVKITMPFAIGRFAVTFDELDAFVRATSGDAGWPKRLMGSAKGAPSDKGWGRGRRPVINVSWLDAVAYAEWLSDQTGEEYKLPTEAEWEYAARAGTTTPFWFGETISTEQANYNGDYVYGAGRKGEYRQKTVPMDTFEPNPWGLYNVHGNVWEWTCSAYNKDYDGSETRCISKNKENAPKTLGLSKI